MTNRISLATIAAAVLKEEDNYVTRDTLPQIRDVELICEVVSEARFYAVSGVAFCPTTSFEFFYTVVVAEDGRTTCRCKGSIEAAVNDCWSGAEALDKASVVQALPIN